MDEEFVVGIEWIWQFPELFDFITSLDVLQQPSFVNIAYHCSYHWIFFRLLIEAVSIYRFVLKTENFDGAYYVYVFSTLLPVKVIFVSRWQVTQGICIAMI